MRTRLSYANLPLLQVKIRRQVRNKITAVIYAIVSKAFEYRIRSDIRRKLRIFETLELPLLQERRFQLSANTQVSDEGQHVSYISRLNEVVGARSVVRTSRRSSEPQAKGSKPFGPAHDLM